jgi:hypothetical protein
MRRRTALQQMLPYLANQELIFSQVSAARFEIDPIRDQL